jgi:hypothetical protein
VFHPLLPDVAGASLNPDSAAALAMWSRALKSLPVVTGAGGRLVGASVPRR